MRTRKDTTLCDLLDQFFCYGVYVLYVVVLSIFSIVSFVMSAINWRIDLILFGLVMMVASLLCWCAYKYAKKDYLDDIKRIRK